jgi:23S rRNA pseudouridine955/2504/2580 synthase
MGTATSATDFSSVQSLVIGPERDGQRVDNCLVALLKGVPRSLIYRLVRTGQVRVNGRRVKADTRLAEGDKLRVPPVRTAERDTSVAAPDTMVEAIQRAVIF